MNSRQMFLDQLRASLKGLPRHVADDILSEYEAHFDEGQAQGRSDSDIAAGLGDPVRLARELRAETGLRRWEDERSLTNALGAIVGVFGLAALDLLIVLPVLLALAALDLAFFLVGIAFCLVGSLLLPLAIVNIGPFGGDWLQSLLVSLGTASGGASLMAMCVLFTIGMVNLLVRYGRAHYRLIAPSLPA
ncbi:DUF1700 domain-containing protein [Novacetimonas cocois]|uniref:DUF1700 domain-containing protein n=1 Tax=Novacetimonas cocois TaxID=1747507 RepID=A0A365Z0C6_9PROT|nr:DUF1700 domain-containing protein [Novacetimonas cocois]RBM08316.1 hypothetical protein NJLHNGOC_05275 [Novacetimonas cocois]